MTEIDIAGDQENTERGGTADTDLQLESEQRAMQAQNDCQNAARSASETARQRVPLPALQTYSDLPREWPMARLAISSKQNQSPRPYVPLEEGDRTSTPWLLLCGHSR